ncbi:MAG: F0F1 ATP synthase subunit B [Alphaproteobacteria bacterium]|nr:F0F1 ATP synthase subunit B [Alphaproteobacteria bacterium]MCD8526038.1 F0F1 ATP synthase subunit B [Alphaproteobacteria bacterium]MCD8570606.1 F0F1 ATP synthase subunit B [Alphaproteobacteria bacterium]
MSLLQDANFWLLGSFLIFAFVCYKYGKDTFLGLLDSRIEKIRKEIVEAENLRIEAQELLAQYQRKHRDAVKEAEKIVSNAEKHAIEIRKRAEAELMETMERREEQFKERMRNMERSAMNEIQSYAAKLSIQATQRIIEENLDKKIATQLVDRSVKNIKAA